MDEPQLSEALQELDRLSHEEYRKSLAEVAMSGDHKERLDRLGRLVGVVLKEPFATMFYSDTPSHHTGAYRGWELNQEAFRNETALSSWQYRMLAKLRQNEHIIETLGYQEATIQDFATMAQYERGWFRFLVVACREYLCNPQLRQEINGHIQAAREAGFDVSAPSMLVGSGAAGAIGTILVQNVPILRLASVPLILLMTIIISNTGLDEFCRWAHEHPVTDEGPPQDTIHGDPPIPRSQA